MEEFEQDTASRRPSDLIYRKRDNGHRVTLELGCGSDKKNPEAIGIDLRALPGVDLVGDAISILQAIPPGSIDAIDSYHFVEHVPDVRQLLVECARVLRPGGVFECTIPHFSNPFYYSDPTHKQPFGLYTFAYLVRDSFTSRKVPMYQDALPFRYSGAIYQFKSSRPHYIRHASKQIGRIFNVSMWMKEWYEERWVWLLPAHEVRFTLIRLHS